MRVESTVSHLPSFHPYQLFSNPVSPLRPSTVSSPDIQVPPKRRRIIVESSPEPSPAKKKAANAAIDTLAANGNNKEQHNNNNTSNNSSNGNNAKAEETSAASLSVHAKEQRLVELRTLLPHVNDLQAQEVLVRADWVVEKARKTLVESGSSSSEQDKSLNSSGEIFDTVEEYKKSKKLENGHSSSSHKHHHHHKTSTSSRSSSSSHHHHHKSPSSSSSSHHHHHRDHKSSSSSNNTHSNNSSSSSNHHHKSPSKSHHHHHSSSSTSSSSHRDKDKKRRSDEHKTSSSHSSSSSSKKSSSHHHHKDHRSTSSSSTSTKPALKPPSHRHSDSDSSSTGRPVDHVYDSDASSGDESNFVANKRRQVVLDFLNEASQSQLAAIKTCSIKKADLLIQLRPFDSWKKLVQAIEASKGLNPELLNNCQELLQRRKKMSVLLKKCQKIIGRLERTAAEIKDKAAVEQPKMLTQELRLADYQLIGLNWLIMMHREGFNGILADEMGLGKTIQVIAFLTYLKEHRLCQVPNLIVVPSSTMDNWDNEMAKWSPQLVVAKYYGSQEERRALRFSFNKGGLEGVDVILTTYHTVASLPEERKMFRTIKIDYVVFDEAHMLKNMTTQRYEHLAKINAARRLLLTGTPLQNNLMELMSLLCFVMPTLFSGSIEDFKTLFQKGGGKQAKTTATTTSEGATADGGGSEPVTSFEQSQIEQAKMVMKPFVLRRLKADVLQCLPAKTATLVTVRMSEEQAQRYTELVEGFKLQRAEMNDDTSGMTVMMEMRKLTNHPLLLRYYFTDEKLREIAKRLASDLEYKKENAEYIFEELAIMSDFQVYQMAQKYTVRRHFENCFRLL